MLDCKLCGETCYTTYICSKCNRIKDLMNLYSRDVVLDAVETIFIRNEKQRTFKIKNKLNEEIKNVVNEKEKKGLKASISM